MARRVPGILPPLTFDEALEVTAVHSVAGLLPPGAGLLTDRPFRAPHHTISDVALVGGGSQPRPGRGQPRAPRRAVSRRDARVQPPRARSAAPAARGRARSTIARAARTAVFPARFMLVGAMNPCPCGFLGDTVRECRCTPQQIARYRGRLSGPLRDRLDLTVEVPALPARRVDRQPCRARPRRTRRARRSSRRRAAVRRILGHRPRPRRRRARSAARALRERPGPDQHRTDGAVDGAALRARFARRPPAGRGDHPDGAQRARLRPRPEGGAHDRRPRRRGRRRGGPRRARRCSFGWSIDRRNPDVRAPRLGNPCFPTSDGVPLGTARPGPVPV